MLGSVKLQQVAVVLRLIDVNDEAPIFIPFWTDCPTSIAKAVLSGESKTPPGTRVFKVQATDADQNAILRYQWTPGLAADITRRFYISSTSVRRL